MVNRLASCRAVVVGGDDIAHACARRLADDGFDVLLAGPQAPDVLGDHVRLLTVDLGDAAGSAAAIAGAAASWPAIEALVNCHMHVEPAGVAELTMAAWQRALEVNATGPLAVTQAVLELLTAAGGAAVVHLGSVDGVFGNPTVAAYSVSKAALVPLTHVMAHELAARSIRVNCVARALVGSAQAIAADPYQSAIAAATPLRRAASPAEIAAVVAFLVSDEASYITGAVLPVDGGRTAITAGTGGG